MCTPSRFSDKEYTNWIKCSLALTHFKEGLHDFIKTEVTNFHAHIQQNIASIPCGSSAGSQCVSCTWMSIKQGGGQQGVWYINCQNKICDKWLSQILLEHNDPHNRNINWKNADISKWPTDGYEVAKVYMPKGQDKTKNLPDDFDAPAILSLLKYCAWFTKQIQTTSILNDLIDLRNEIMHSGDLKVTDSKTNSGIDKMIQLVSELNIPGGVCTELQKLKREDIVINFQETEIKVLQNRVSCLKRDLTTLKEDMASVHSKMSQLSKEVKHSSDDTKEATGNVDTLEAAVKQKRKSLDELGNIADKMATFFDNNTDIHDTKVTETIQNIRTDVQGLLGNLSNVEKDLVGIKARLTKQEEATEQLRKDVEELKGLKKGREQNENDELSLQKEAEHLRAELLSRYKSLRTIPISYFYKEEEGMYLLDKLYTDIVMSYNDKEIKNGEKVQTDKHLFKGRRRIILTGLSGSGKSTFCRKIVNRWCNLKANKKTDANAEGTGTSTHDSLHVINSTSVTDSFCTKVDEDLIKFDLLFYIDSPAISNETTLAEVLCNQLMQKELCGDQDEIKTKVQEILNQQQENILMIFDGLDELGHTPDFLVKLFKRTFYPEMTVLMGTRPWHISRLGLKPTDHYDLHLDIHGFSRDNALGFVKKVIEENNSLYKQIIDTNISSEAQEIMLSFKNVPLLLLFLTQIWYIDQRLPDKRIVLYKDLIDNLIERCLKKTGNKYTESSLDQENRDQIGSNGLCKQYLNSACNVAYFLLKRKDVVSGVILQEELIQELGEDADRKLSFLQDTGIMSKVNIFSPGKEKKVSVTFLHMSVQEYLASIHLVQNEDAFQSFLQSLKTLNDVLRYENLFIFVCGLNAGQGHKAFIRICQVCDVDPYVQKHRQGDDDDDDDGYSYFKVKDDIESLNKMYKACIGEMDTKEPLQIPDIIAQNDEWFKLVISRQSSQHVRSLTLSRFSVIHCEHDLSSLRYLTSLTLWHLLLSEEQSRSLCTSISSFTQLQKLELVEIILTDVVIDLSNLHDLAFFTLKPKLNTNDTTGFINLSACTKLKQLNLHGIRLNEGELDLKKLTDLTHLTLSSLRKSKECTISLCNSLSACTKLKKLDLNSTTLRNGTLNLNALTNLTFLTLSYVSLSAESSTSLCSNISNFTCLKRLNLSNTHLNDGILDLNTLTQLTHLTLVSVTMSKNCSNRLCNSIRSGNIAHLKTLELDDIRLHDSVLDLMTLTSLTHLELKRLTMCEECAKFLCNNSLSACTKLKKLGLYDITLHGCVPDLKKLTSLTELILSTLTMSKESAVTLSKSISACTNLKLLWLEHISLHDAVLDLKKLGNLIVLQLANVTMSNECRKILEESKIHCPELSNVGSYPDKDNWQQF